MFPFAIVTPIVSINRECVLANRIFAAFMNLAGKELAELLDNKDLEARAELKKMLEYREAEIGKRFSNEIPMDPTQHFYVSYRLLSLFVERLLGKNA